METEMMNFTCYAATRIGSREKNQDNFCAAGEMPFSAEKKKCVFKAQSDTEESQLFAVCDGVGSLANSDETAYQSLQLLKERMQGLNEADDRVIWLEDAFADLDDEIRCLSDESGIDGANTLTALILKGNQYLFANIGDSPAFLLRDGELTELSVRHNMATYKMRIGQTPSDADSSRLLYCIGSQAGFPKGVINIVSGEIRSGDIFLLCSDGIVNTLGEENLTKLLPKKNPAKKIAVKASRARYSDNCTAVVVRIE